MNLRRGALGAFVAGALLVPAVVTGCTQDQRQTSVVESRPVESTSTITPLERGTIRREALATARAGIAAWRRNDPDAMRSTFTTSYVDFYKKLYKKYDAKGQVRVRKYVDVFPMDVSDMNSDGSQVLVDWQARDGSYVKTTSGRIVTAPTNATTTIQLTLHKIGGKWTIVRMFGEDSVMQ